MMRFFQSVWTAADLSYTLSARGPVQTVSKTTKQHRIARFSGERWVVAMSDADWGAFCALPDAANLRLARMFEHFCRCGDGNLPKACVRWMTPAANAAAGRNLGAFEAYGVIVQGRRVEQGAPGIFHVTEILTESFKPPARGGRRAASDERQKPVPFIK